MGTGWSKAVAIYAIWPIRTIHVHFPARHLLSNGRMRPVLQIAQQLTLQRAQLLPTRRERSAAPGGHLLVQPTTNPTPHFHASLNENTRPGFFLSCKINSKPSQKKKASNGCNDDELRPKTYSPCNPIRPRPRALRARHPLAAFHQ